MRRKLLILGLAGCAAIGVSAVWAVGSLLTGPTNTTVPAPPHPAQTLSISSAPDTRLAGTYWAGRPSAPAILVLHGNGSNRGTTFERAAWLNAQGYAVLAIDFRGHGESTPARKSFGLHESADAKAAFDWLKRHHPGRIGVLGYSLGGAASLLGDAPLPADAFVFEAVYPDIRRAVFNRIASRLGRVSATLLEPLLSFQSLPRLGVWPEAISPIRALPRVTAPVMIVGSRQDLSTPPSDTRAMFEAVHGRGELQMLDGLTHDELGRVTPEPYKVELQRFLKEALGPP